MPSYLAPGLVQQEERHVNQMLHSSMRCGNPQDRAGAAPRRRFDIDPGGSASTKLLVLADACA